MHSFSLASAFGHSKVLRYLLANKYIGVNLAYPIAITCITGQLNIIKILLDTDIELLSRLALAGKTLLHVVAVKSQEEVVR
jgi:hypothetical protein